MARIRTIKPEFPQSESMGKISRDSRLLFIQMWTLADDSGRLRGNSRMLASLLFPYDDDARELIPTWMDELKREKCIVSYQGEDGSSYVAITNWESHQKIDKPSKSKIPPPSSRTLANPRELSPATLELSSEDQGPRKGPRTKDQGEEGECSKSLSKHSENAEFKKLWGKWQLHLTHEGKPMNAVSEDAVLMELQSFETSEAIKIVQFSIARGAKNLITNGDHNSNPKRSNGKPKMQIIGEDYKGD